MRSSSRLGRKVCKISGNVRALIIMRACKSKSAGSGGSSDNSVLEIVGEIDLHETLLLKKVK